MTNTQASELIRHVRRIADVLEQQWQRAEHDSDVVDRLVQQTETWRKDIKARAERLEALRLAQIQGTGKAVQ